MATAVRLSHPGRPAVAGAARGDFGIRVLELLSGTCKPKDDLEDLFDGDAGVVVLALSRPSPALCAQADELAHRTGTAWLPIVPETTLVRVGPYVRPRTAPCFDCYAERRSQHDRHRHRTEILHRAFDDDDGLGPTGFLPHTARLAAAGARLALRRALPGEVITLRTDDARVSADTVLPRSSCARCGTTAHRRPLLETLRLGGAA
jgi:bacteriocin biosynthesis cyclodehydratase domain-containing protein